MNPPAAPGAGEVGEPGDTEDHPDTALLRLQRVLAQVGLGSRRHCDELVAEGRVEVNGEVALPGRRVDPTQDRITVDGVLVPTAPDLLYFLLNKPRGVITSAHDPQGRPTVLSLVPSDPRVFPVGRLDAESEGLLVLTNDGDFAHILSHPSGGVPKEYLVQVEGEPGPGALRALRHGVDLPDGRTAPARVGTVGPGVFRLTVHEGRNRLVRRMCEAVGHPVTRLVRTRIGTLSDSSLKPGVWRPLAPHEVRSLLDSAQPASRQPVKAKAARRPAQPGGVRSEEARPRRPSQ